MVNVLVEECDDDEGRAPKDEVAASGGGEGEPGEWSGFAIRNPPKVSDRLISPFMVDET